MGSCKKYVTPLLTHWSYIFLAQPIHMFSFDPSVIIHAPLTSHFIAGLYLTVSVCLAGFNLFCQMLITNLYMNEHSTEMPAWIKTFVSRFNKSCCGQRGKVQPANEDRPRTETDDNVHEVETQPGKPLDLDQKLMKELCRLIENRESEGRQNELKDEWKRFARLLDVVFFIISVVLNTTMIVVYFVNVS